MWINHDLNFTILLLNKIYYYLKQINLSQTNPYQGIKKWIILLTQILIKESHKNKFFYSFDKFL